MAYEMRIHQRRKVYNEELEVPALVRRLVVSLVACLVVPSVVGLVDGMVDQWDWLTILLVKRVTKQTHEVS